MHEFFELTKLAFITKTKTCFIIAALYSLHSTPVDAFLLDTGIKEEIFILKYVAVNKGV